MDIRSKIKARIVTLKADLDTFITMTNTKVQLYQVAIGELEDLLKPEEVKANDTEIIE